jgi:hypothetical protein
MGRFRAMRSRCAAVNRKDPGEAGRCVAFCAKEMTWYSRIQRFNLCLSCLLLKAALTLIDAPISERRKPFPLDAPASLPKSRFWDVTPYTTAVESRNLRQ